MPKRPIKPWFRTSTQTWYVQIQGTQINLGKDKDAAFREFHRLMASDEPPRVSDSPSVLEILSRFLQWSASNHSEGTQKWYRWRIGLFIGHLSRANLTHLKGADLRPFHLYDWVDNQPTWGPGYRHGCLRAVQRSFNWADEVGILKPSPIAKIKKPSPEQRTFVFTDEMLDKMLAATDEPFRQFLTAAIYTGARTFEIRRVTAKECRNNCTQWHWPKGKRNKPRTVYLPDNVVEIVRDLVELHPEGPIFRNTKGEPWTKNAINLRLQRLRAKLGLPKDAVPYSVRHTFATRRLEAGQDVLTVARLMGHSTTAMVDRIYSHLSDKYLEEEAKKHS